MAFKELRRHKLRTILTIIGIAIGILLVTTLSSFSEGINSIIETEVSFLSGMITVVDEGTGWGNFLSSEIDESLGDEFLGIPGVDRVAGLILGNVPDVGPIYGGKPEDFDLFEIRLEDYIKDGRVMEAGEPEVMIGINYAKFSGYQTGDEITIRGKKYDVVGEMKTTGSEEDSGIITSLETAQEILKKEGIVSIIIVKPVSVSDARGIADEINRIYDSVDAGTDEDARREAAEFTGQTSATTWAMGSIAAVIAALGIMNVMFMSVRERRKEIGTMKALGATNYQVLSEIVLEAIIISLTGALIGILLSYVAVDAINSELGVGGIAKITPGLLINVTLFAVFLGIFGGLIPARQASKLDPAVVLRYE